MHEPTCCPWPQYCSCAPKRAIPPPRVWEPVFDLGRSSDAWEITRDVLLGEVARTNPSRGRGFPRNR